jgi:tetratricopeptide (TPR) repeat protein
MDTNDATTVRAVKRLSEAIGYLELGMTRQAVACLDHVEAGSPVSPLAEVLRGEVARREHRLDDATRYLETAAQMLPKPASKSIWLALSVFQRQLGDTELAINSLGRARGAHLRKPNRKAD